MSATAGYEIWHLRQRNALHTARLVARLAKAYGHQPLMRAFVVQQVLAPARVDQRDELAAARAIHRWVTDHIRFANEPGEQVLTPARCLAWRFGDCDDRSGLVGAMLTALRIPVRMKLLARGGVPFHIWPVALIGGRAYHLETCDKQAKFNEHPAALMRRIQGLQL